MKYFFKYLFLLFVIPNVAIAGGGLRNSLETSASGMIAQSERIKIITENIANADTTGLTPDSTPYRRKTIFFENVRGKNGNPNMVMVKKVKEDQSDFKLFYRPDHPAANADGYVKYPNVDKNLESIDLKEAQRSYEANVTAIENTKQMMERSLDLMR